MIFRKALEKDLDAVAAIYEEIIDAEEKGKITVGWERGVYPTRETAEEALKRGDLFVMEDEGIVEASAVINRMQMDCYREGSWKYSAGDESVCVLHTLTVSPSKGGRGLGKSFVRFYEEYARSIGCSVLRMDTNALNTRARMMYKKLGFEEAGIVPTEFNGIPGVDLVLLEKRAETI